MCHDEAGGGESARLGSKLRIILRLLTEPRDGKLTKVERAASRLVRAVEQSVRVIATILIVLATAFMCTNDDLECWLKGDQYMEARGAVCPATYWWERLLPHRQLPTDYR